VLSGNGKGGFQSQTRYLTSDNPFGIFAANFNGDNQPDVVQVAHTTRNTLITFLNILK
jgi:hypothetical protein